MLAKEFQAMFGLVKKELYFHSKHIFKSTKFKGVVSLKEFIYF